MVEAPYGIIARQLVQGRITPFIGAGASLAGRPAVEGWKDEFAGFLPAGGELSRRLAELARFPVHDASDLNDLAKVASFFQAQSDRLALDDLLHQVFSKSVEPTPVHRLLAAIERPLLIVTTNYDRLMERALDEARRPYHLVVHPSEHSEYAGSVLWWPPGEKSPHAERPSELDIEPDSKSIVYKMHGSVDMELPEGDSFLITEEDYVDFLARMTSHSAVPARFKLHFRRTRMLFLGYSLSDWNLRVLLRNLRDPRLAVGPREAERDRYPAKSWAIQRNPSELERALWHQRHVGIYDADLLVFASELRSALDRVKRPQ